MVGSAISKQPFFGNNEVISHLILIEIKKNNLIEQIIQFNITLLNVCKLLK
jgi:hypothetical protein